MTKPPTDVTRLLVEWGGGQRQALDRLLPLVHDELHRLARAYFARESAGHTLQPTALVNEAYLRLVDQSRVRWQNRSHFFAIAAQMMRRVLVDHARERRAAKRGSGVHHLSLDESLLVPDEGAGVDFVELDDALEALAQIDARQSRLVELRFFAGLSIEETAEALAVSPATVKREWSLAKAWLFRRMKGQAPESATRASP